MPRKTLSSRWYNQGDTNIIPFVDVSLILLIVFMIGSPLALESIYIEVPEISQSQSIVSQGPIIITIDADGNYYLGSSQLPLEFVALRENIDTMLQDRPEATIYIRADQNVVYYYITSLMSSLQKDGIYQFGLISETYDH